MAEYSGSALYLSWIHPGGTVVFSSDYRSFNDDPEGDLIEVTAGSDAYKNFIGGVSSGKCSLTYLEQASGTANYNSLAFGTFGTLIYGAEGTAAGKPKRTIPLIALGARKAFQYANAVEVSTEWQYNGTPTNGAY